MAEPPSGDAPKNREHLVKGILVDGDVADLPIAKRWAAYGAQQGIPVTVMGVTGEAIHQDHTLFTGKRVVFVTRYRGPAAKECRGLEGDCVCCRLQVINQTVNCPFNCSYCFLQAYVNAPVTTIHANLEEMLVDLEGRLASQPKRLFRLTTGDLGDSLAWDYVTRANESLVPWFAQSTNGLLELKTKSDRVEPLLDLGHGGRTVVSWSVNTPAVIQAEEHGTASLQQRLQAASRVVQAGYPVAFHFDPMVAHPGWEEAYVDVVRQIFEAVPANRVTWISMGSLRFPSEMLKSLEQHFPQSRLYLGELKLALDGKMRYFKPIRIQLYRTLNTAIRELGGPDVFTYLCMELPEVWRRVRGHVPEIDWGLDFEFARSLASRFPGVVPTAPMSEHYTGVPSLHDVSKPSGLMGQQQPPSLSPDGTNPGRP